MGNLNQTPNANRLHIGIFGKRNAGKSSLINAITNQNAALVSDVAGTTTDPVYKAMEVRYVGACVFIDTAGFDDIGELGELRVEQTMIALSKSDIAIMLFCDDDFTYEEKWISSLKERNTPILAVISKSDLKSDDDLSLLAQKIKDKFELEPITTSVANIIGVDKILEEIARLIPPEKDAQSLTGHLAKPNDVVLLVMPQDSEAPKGRLILPQVQTIRDLLDNGCVVSCCTEKTFESSLATLASPPDLIITDSQVFSFVYDKKPKKSKLTSFSVLLAGFKGDLATYINGANTIENLNESSHILIAEACTHAPLSEDIGRVKIPVMLKKRFGSGLSIDIVSGTNFPKDLKKYSLIIHCGGCMFNRKYLMSRLESANAQNVPITNYGILIAKLSGILDKIVY